MSDPLSDVLNLIGVESSVYIQKDFRGSWCMDISNTGFAQFHILVRGSACVTHAGQIMQLSADDIVLFPKGASHFIGDTPDSSPTLGSDVIHAMREGREPFTEGDNVTRMICGHFEYDFACSHPLLDNLPEVVLIHSADLSALDHLFSLVQLIIRESASDEPSSEVVTRRLSDGLVVTVLRSFFKQNKERTGFFRSLSDRRIALAISAIHNDVHSQLTIDDMAAYAGMSRSSFSQRFKDLVGQSAGSYATRWKLLKARLALRTNNDPIDKIAFANGYVSAAAFSRAFNTTFGETPTQCRRKMKHTSI